MKRIVVYKSETGFTERYAKEIASKLQCEAVNVKTIQADTLESYDQVIYGGWIMGGMISGLNKVKSKNVKSLVVFGVGITPAGQKVEDQIRKENQLGDTPLFYFVGGINFEKLSFIKRGALNIVRKGLVKKENKTKDEEMMAKLMEKSFDHIDLNSVQPLVDFCQK